jgi:hypothetical protein
VVEARREVEDDYIQSGLLLVDMDAGGEQPPKPDVSFKIQPSKVDALSPGTAVSFVAVIREYGYEEGAPLLRLELKALK